MKRIALVGFGLLAGSIASALKQAKRPTVIRAVSSPATLARARELELADEFFEYGQVEEWSHDCDLILLCGPILHILKTIDALSHVKWASDFAAGSNGADLNGAACLVSDIGSTKVEICKAGIKLPAPFKFVGSHPMAGSEKRSCEYNDPSGRLLSCSRRNITTAPWRGFRTCPRCSVLLWRQASLTAC